MSVPPTSPPPVGPCQTGATNIGQIAASQQQLTGIDQVALAMQNIRQASAQNIASTREVERAARDLDELTQHLTTLVAAGRKADRNGNGVHAAS